MSTKKFGDKLEELDLSHEEIDRLTKCMKDKKFRDLLKEYAEEISDPVNRKKYEEEIATLERDRGMDVKFINPKPGHVLKTSINGLQKCFINICTNENLGQPKSRPSVQGKTRGMQWSIPHSVSQAREDVDKAGSKCIVYDVVFHPDTYYLLKKDTRFKKMIHDTALDAIERQFDVKLDKVNIRTPKMTFKGLPMSSVIRTPNVNGPTPHDPSLEEVDMKLHPPYPPPETKQNGSSTAHGLANGEKFDQSSTKVQEMDTSEKKAADDSNHHTPHYTITHRGHFDIQDFRNSSEGVHDTRPKELVINVDLPLLSAANSVNLEIFERKLHLDSEKPAKYKLDFDLPYPVAENKGYAKFDKTRHRLTVTLEVLPVPKPCKLTSNGCLSLVAEVEANGTHSEEPSSGETADNKGTMEDDSCSHNCDSKVSAEDRPMTHLIEATEATTETLLTDISSTAKPKEANFVEEGRRHYQEGSDWRDEDDDSGDPATIKDTPLTKNSAFLIDMVMKYEGLIRRCPQYAFHQDETYVTFVIEVPHIFEQSLWYAVYSNMLQFCCLSECLDDDMVNSVFQLWIEFEKDFAVVPQRSRVDVSGNNAVFCLRKAVRDVEWQRVKAGFDKDNLEVRRFSTTRNVCELYTLVAHHAEGASTSALSVCEVVRKEDELVIIRFKDKESSSDGKSHHRVDHAIASRDHRLDVCSQTNMDKDSSLEEPRIEPEQGPVIPVPPCDDADPVSVPPSSVSGTGEKIEAVEGDVTQEVTKCVSFAKDVEDTEELSHPDVLDSDEEEECGGRVAPAQGALFIKRDEGRDEVVVDHVTESAIELAAESLALELDDDL